MFCPMKHLPITPPLQILVYSLLQRLCCAFIAQRHKFEAIRNKDYSVVKTSKAAKIFSRFFFGYEGVGVQKKLGGCRVLGWALTDSNRRPSACKADALNQLS